MRYKVTTCDICGKDITTEYQFRFRYWHYRIGTHHVKHMCQECYFKFIEFAKQSEVAECLKK